MRCEDDAVDEDVAEDFAFVTVDEMARMCEGASAFWVGRITPSWLRDPFTGDGVETTLTLAMSTSML